MWSVVSSRSLFPSRRRHTNWNCDWSSDVCSSDLFDVTHAFTLSAAQDLHFEHLGIQSDRTHLLTKGWALLSISSITSGSPFTVYSGIQQTGAGRSEERRGRERG